MAARLAQQEQAVEEERVALRQSLSSASLADETLTNEFVAGRPAFLDFPAVDTALQLLKLAESRLPAASRAAQQPRPD